MSGTDFGVFWLLAAVYLSWCSLYVTRDIRMYWTFLTPRRPTKTHFFFCLNNHHYLRCLDSSERIGIILSLHLSIHSIASVGFLLNCLFIQASSLITLLHRLCTAPTPHRSRKMAAVENKAVLSETPPSLYSPFHG